MPLARLRWEGNRNLKLMHLQFFCTYQYIVETRAAHSKCFAFE